MVRTSKIALRVHLFALCGYLLLTIVMTWPLTANLTTAIPGDSFDGWQNYWNLWWLKVALVDRVQSPLATDLLYAPTGVSLYFHTLNPFNGLITLPIQVAGNLYLAYNAVVFLSWTLGGYGVFLLTRRILGCRGLIAGTTAGKLPIHSAYAKDAAAFLAGVVFTFSPLHMAHLLGHMQVMSLQWIPFYLLYLLLGLQAAVSGRAWLRDGLLAGCFLTLVGLCDWYFVLYLFFFTGLAIMFFWLSGLQTRRRIGRVDLRLAVAQLLRACEPPFIAAAVFVILLSPMLVPMVQEATQFSFMVRPQSDLYILSASVADFFVPNRLHTLFRPESFGWIGNQIAPISERTIGIGYLALALSIMAVGRDRKRTMLWLAGALFFFAMALGPAIRFGNITWDSVPPTTDVMGSFTPFAVLNRLVPFMRISRSVSRYALMVQLCVAVMSGIGSAWLLRKGAVNPRRTTAYFVLMLGVLLAEYWVVPFPISPPDTPSFYTDLAEQPGKGAVLNLPMNYDRPGYLLYQTVHKRPLAVAYISRDDSRTLTERMPVLQHLRHLEPDIIDATPAQVGPTILTDLGIELVALDRYKMPGGLERTYTEEVAGSIFGDQTPLFEDERLSVYAVTPPLNPAPYMVLGDQNWGALETNDDGALERPLLPGEATVALHHVKPGAAVRLRYRTDPRADFAVLHGADWEALASQPHGGEVVLSVDAYLTNRSESGGGELVFSVAMPDTVWVQEIEVY